MATVYLATDLRLERRVAIKIMHGHLSDDTKFKERFIQEARSAARLAHPNVVNVFDQGQDTDMAYLVMEYLPGITLRDLLQEHKKLTTEQTLDILEAVLAGLSAAHKAGIVHRDLKPENVLLADDGRIKIGDFGLARAASANTATGAALLGTIAYLSPELVTRGVADTRSDIYAVGIMTYEMLTGEQPFKGEQPMQIAYQHANDSVPTPSGKNPRVPVDLDELVLWATAREPDERPRDARAMLDEVLSIQSGLQSGTAATATQRTMVFPTAVPPGQRGTLETQILSPARRRETAPITGSVDELSARAHRRRTRGRWLIALFLVLLALVGGTAWYFGTGPGSQVIIPSSLKGTSVADARAQLEKLGLKVDSATGQHTDPTVATGEVMGTNPAIGSTIAKNAPITLIRSIGPAQLALPNVVGSPESDARRLVIKAGFVAAKTSVEQFDGKVPIDQVIDDLDANGKSLRTQSTYSEARTIQFVVSAGPLPIVNGMTVSAAEAKLSAAGLGATPGTSIYDPTVPKGDVIKIDSQTKNGVARVFRKGQNDVLLITSRGPQMVDVPSIVGDSWDVAKKALTAAGFELTYNHAADLLPAAVTVTGTDPAPGSSLPKGSNVTVHIKGLFG
ncbi:MAG: eukaryotic-like serine/threonine-protein kinase [Actinomycetota bacterium]|jgi:serine/threonine-protein kinase|nr:eukaryotic-like serine/threonine-protein kinase [Actinomycetota bacterium]